MTYEDKASYESSWVVDGGTFMNMFFKCVGLREFIGVQGGEDPQDAVSLQVIFRKWALLFVALLRNMTCN